MRQAKFKPITKAFLLASISLSLFAFEVKAGGDVYEIYLNNKLILKQFVAEPFSLKILGIDKANPSDAVVIFYSHCGKPGKGRRIIAKDEKGSVLKEWKFADLSGRGVGMKIPAAELLQLQKTTPNLDLLYTSQELPKGRMLTSFRRGAKSITYCPAPKKDFYRSTLSFCWFS